jgi:hypothetical protein
MTPTERNQWWERIRAKGLASTLCLALIALAIGALIACEARTNEKDATEVSADTTCDSCSDFGCEYEGIQNDIQNQNLDIGAQNQRIAARRTWIAFLQNEDAQLTTANSALNGVFGDNFYWKVTGFTLRGGVQAWNYGRGMNFIYKGCTQNAFVCAQQAGNLIQSDMFRTANINLGVGFGLGVADSAISGQINLVKSIPGVNVVYTGIAANEWSANWFGAADQIAANSAYIDGNVAMISNLVDQIKSIQAAIAADQAAIANDQQAAAALCATCASTQHEVNGVVEPCDCSFCNPNPSPSPSPSPSP